MPTGSVKVLYDSYGGFSIQGHELAEIANPELLADVRGGVLDAGCGGGNAVCGNLLNFIFCVDALCGQNFRDTACVSNAVCVHP